MATAAPHRLLAIVTDELDGTEPIEEIRRAGNGSGTEVRLVVPAVEATAFRHTLGDIDEPKREAEERLRAALESLRRNGVSATGEVGDPDPVQAAQDALLEAPADEVVIFERESGQARWFEEGLFARAQESLEPPLRMVVVHTGDADGEHVVAIEEAGPGTVDADASEVSIPISHNLPLVPRADLAGMVTGIVGTIDRDGKDVVLLEQLDREIPTFARGELPHFAGNLQHRLCVGGADHGGGPHQAPRRMTMAEATDFVRDHDLMTLLDDPCVIEEMPEFARGVAAYVSGRMAKLAPTPGAAR